MPNRILKESITTSATLAELSGDEERCFTRLLVVCDDFGRFDGRASIIRGRAFTAMLERVSEADVARWLDALVRVGLVIPYTAAGKPYLYVPTFPTHQQRRASKSKFPDPPDGQPPAADITRYHLQSDVPVFVSENEIGNETESGFESAPDPLPFHSNDPEPLEPVPTPKATALVGVLGVSLVKAPIPEALVLTPTMRRIALEEDGSCSNVPACFKHYKGWFWTRRADPEFWRFDFADFEWRCWMQRHRRFGGPCQRKPTVAENVRDAESRRKEDTARRRAPRPDEPSAFETALGSVLGDAEDHARARVREQAARLKATA